jgi:hypothetical protein
MARSWLRQGIDLCRDQAPGDLRRRPVADLCRRRLSEREGEKVALWVSAAPQAATPGIGAIVSAAMAGGIDENFMSESAPNELGGSEPAKSLSERFLRCVLVSRSACWRGRRLVGLYLNPRVDEWRLKADPASVCGGR